MVAEMKMTPDPDPLLSIHDHDLHIRAVGTLTEYVWDCDPLPAEVSSWLVLLERKAGEEELPQ